MTIDLYPENYYNTNNYSDYMERGEKYERTAIEVINFLNQINLKNRLMLDFGCGPGLFIEGLIKAHNDNMMNIYGYEISEWSKQKCKEKGLNMIEDYSNGYWRMVFFLDVLEHIKEDDLDEIFANILMENFIFRIPVCKNQGEEFALEVSAKDPTHVTCWTKKQWEYYFNSKGFKVFDLNLYNIYNSEGVYCGLATNIR